MPIDMSDMGEGEFVNAILDFYLSNPIARASTLMAELSAAAKSRISNQAVEAIHKALIVFGEKVEIKVCIFKGACRVKWHD